ncbi:MAG: hypothetical protein JXB05_02500 [Myxococcaceae bacterium]|nr:hypothetical protein [Myxococcaceae bacterium]
MYGDFSRGHRPDRRRGRAYQRVLLQQGRTLLDSDFNALADAGEQRLRELAMDLGLDAGSLDSGFLITAGPLLARFDSLEHVEPSAAPFSTRLDHRHKLGGRLPALVLDATQGPGSVRITPRRSLAGLRAVRIWAQTSSALRVRVGGISRPLAEQADPTRYRPYEVLLPDAPTEELVLEFLDSGLGRQARVALVEGVLPETEVAPFWLSRGRYRLGGLSVELAQDGAWPEVFFPKEKGFEPTVPAPGRYVAYLEAWERHITAVEDPGLREPALGGAQDTCTRVEAVGQVKLARLVGEAGVLPTPGALREAFRAAGSSGSRLTLEGTSYSGMEGRLYRFEVHEGGAPGEAVLKWSRNNGAELHPVLGVSSALDTVLLPADADVRNGDLIEVLSETVELGDEGEGQLSGAPVVFTPAQWAVGALFHVREAANPEAGRRFELRDVDTGVLTQLDATLAKQPGLKVRRWHGLLEPGTQATRDVEAGIRVRLEGGPFRAGEFWQYEARRGMPFSQAEWTASAHGPERMFAPLAVVQLQGAAASVEVLQWVDSPVSLERISADQVLFEGSAVGSAAATAQAALEELYALARHDCLAYLEPGIEGEDDGARLNEVIQTRLIPGGVVCLGRGVYTLRTTVDILGKAVELRAAEGTVLVADVPGGPALRVRTQGRLTLTGLTVMAGSSCGPELISADEDALALVLHGCGLAHGRGDAGGIAVHASFADPLLPPRERGEELSWDGFGPIGPTLELRDSVVAAGWGVVAGELEGLSVRGSTLVCSKGGVAARDVRLLEVADSALDTGLDANRLELINSTPALGMEQALEQVVASQQVLPHATGVALRAARVGRGTVDGALMAASMGLWLGAGANLRLSRNRYMAGDTAVRVDGATDVVLEGEEVVAGLLGVHVPVAATGLSLVGCRVRAERGVVLGGEYLLAPTPEQREAFPPPSLVSLRDVRVGTCTLEGTRAALHLGPHAYDEAEPPAVELWNVEVASNLLRGLAPLAVGLSGVLPFPGGASPAVRITGNQLEAAQVAVWLTGGGVELSGNRVYTDGPGALDEAWPTGAVLLVATARVWAEGNQLELGSTGCGLCVRGGSDVRVARNRFLGPAESRPLWATDTHRLEVVENELRAGQSLLARLEGVGVSSNHVGGALVIRNSGDGVVESNRVEETEAFPLSIELARGRWQVGGNRVAGGLRVLPMGVSTLLEDINGMAAELPGAGVGRLGGPLRPPWLSRAQNPEAPGGWVGELVERLQGVISELVVYGASLGRVVSGLTEVEGAVQLLVQGNWARDVQVGSLHPTDAGLPEAAGLPVAEPHGQSIVQVLGNRVDARLVVNHYEQCVVTHNVGQRLVVGSSRANRILEPNLRLG